MLEKMVALGAAGLTTARRRAVSRGLSRALDLIAGQPAVDPLAAVDEPMDPSEAAAMTLRAEMEAQDLREALLARCVSAADAARVAGRSRQALERLRRLGRILALRVGNQWRYPRWQFELDGPGGVVPGLGRVLEALHLSPFGAALWLERFHPGLGGRSPITALRRNEAERVVRLAEEHGHML